MVIRIVSGQNVVFLVIKFDYMKIFTSEQVKLIDKYTIENEPVSSINLMERAASQCIGWLTNKFSRNFTFKIFVGPGNNGGDGLAIARLLEQNDYKVAVYLIKVSDKLSPDASINLDLLIKNKKVTVKEIIQPDELPQINADDVTIDALFGYGLSRPLTGLAAETIEYLNRCPGPKVAIDIPSGLTGEGVVSGSAVFVAADTLTFQFPFLSFLFAENSNYIGKWRLMNIGLHPQIINQTPSVFHLLELNDISIKNRPEFGHKGTFGHALLIAGSSVMAGASVLSSKSCLRTGCGLITVHIPKDIANIIYAAFPESLVSTDLSNKHFSSLPDISKFSAIGIGPGIGTAKESVKALHELLEICNKPLVIDADALNIISMEKELLKIIPKNSVLTPHPLEFDRLFGKSTNSYERLLKQLDKAHELGICIVLKGHYTSVASPDGTCYFNSTGNSGMATGGSGDVLTGIILSLLAQGYESKTAAINGVFIHGMAGDIAAEETGMEALIASDIINCIGKAFIKIKLTQDEKS